jgi:hypothetical protein
VKRLFNRTAIHKTAAAAFVLLLALPAAFAQGPVDPNSGPDGQQAAPLPPEQLDDLVAPIALYPDQLLSQVLVASTYPLEVVEAQQWLQKNGGLRGQALMDAARQQNWDASVQAMVGFPDVVAKLNQNVQWMTALGNAFLAQQSDVMAAVQRMRGRAQSNGRLSSTPQQTVTTETQGGQTAIDIAPADPQVIYVPQYDPMYVWGPPVWGYYPPLAYYGYGFGFYPGINVGFLFGGWGGWGGFGWGWGPNWFGGRVFLNGGFFNHYGFRSGFIAGGFGGRALWQHDAAHRLGVAYPNRALASRYGATSIAARSAMTRSNFNASRTTGVGNGNRFGSGTSSSFANNRPSAAAGARNAATPGNAARSGSQGWSHFNGAQGSPAPAQRSQGYQGSTQRYSAPAQQHYSAPSSTGARNFSSGAAQSAPRSYSGGSAPRSSGGGQSFGGGGGHTSGGGQSSGGGHSSGGHSGGGRR